MAELVRLFMQIALLRRGPQDLPASTLLLALTVLAYVIVNLLVSLVVPPAKELAPAVRGGWLAPLAISTLFTLAWYAVLLRLVKRPERTLQTTTAVFGFQTVLAPLSVVFEWLMRHFAEDSTWQVAITSAALMMAAWLIAANSNIVKAALEWSGMASAALVILQIVTNYLLLVALFAPAST